MEANNWGEYESVYDNSEEEVDFEEIDALVDHKPITQDKLKLYLPYEEDEFGEVVQVPEECLCIDEKVLHTIKLLQHSRALKELLHNAYALQNGLGQSVTADVKQLPDPPLLPDGPRKPPKCIANFPFRYIEKEISEFSEGDGVPPVTLSATVTRRVLRKVIATLLAHIGFETTSASVLEVLCGVCHEYLQKMTQLMRVAADREAMAATSGFPDVMERVFHEMGIGSVCTLHAFYQSRVCMYHARMVHTCQLLGDEYVALRRSLFEQMEEKANARAKTTDEDEDNVPEIHFPAAYGEGGEGDMLQPTLLETGFQMLQTLEQETQLQQAEGSDEDDDEVINVSDSPGGAEARGGCSSSCVQSKPRKRKRKNNSNNT
ncbi:STAGA complex 65 subunit gamma-like [Ischnura elegans]|uniref:STAGA complex 65 subunit gamma-like n=1 Tax=Ischnura elegans TaxID=197161 RepID=UPI001ED8BDEE|nr:STAGA complex 65 subunit gamma-like [Ischnura elegans]